MRIGWGNGLLAVGLVLYSAGLVYAGEASGNPMTRTQTIQVLSERTGLTKLQVNAVFIELAKLSVEEAGRGVVVPELGKLTLVDRAARTGRNPATGAVIQIPASKKLKFKIAKSLSDAAMGKP